GLTRQTYLDAFSAAQFAARLSDGIGIAEVARAARSAPRPAGDEATPGDVLLDAFVTLTEDYAAAVPAGRNALARLRSDTNPAGETLRWLWQGCVLALELWDDESAYVLSERHLQVARKTGALSELPLALGSHTPILVFCGEIAAAASLAGEARSVLQAAGIAEAPYGALILYAWQGRARDARGNLPRRGCRGRHLRVLARRPVQRPRRIRRGADRRPGRLRGSDRDGGPQLEPGRTDRVRGTSRDARSGRGHTRPADQEGPGLPNGLGSRHRGPVTCPAEHERRTPVP